jgi:hypothetical protein
VDWGPRYTSTCSTSQRPRAATGAVDRLLDAVDIDGGKRRTARDEALGIHAANEEAGIVPVGVHDVRQPPERVAESAQHVVADRLFRDDADARRRVLQRVRIFRAIDRDAFENDFGIALLGECRHRR